MARLYVCLDASVPISSSKRRKSYGVYHHHFIINNSDKFALEKWIFLAILAFVVAMVLDFYPLFLYFVVMR